MTGSSERRGGGLGRSADPATCGAQPRMGAANLGGSDDVE